MTPVGGSRHYDGGGLGQVAAWDCPRCGAENMGPLAQGCTACGSGAPGRHVGTPPPPAPPAPTTGDEAWDAFEAEATRPRPEPEGPSYNGAVRQGDIAINWAERHPEATVEEAYRQGYLEGVRQAREAQQRQADTVGRPLTYAPDHIINRTIVAALSLFRDQVLAGEPEETTTGEWLTQHQVTALIAQIEASIHG